MVEARDLDTDNRQRVELTVDAPSDGQGKQAQLLANVQRLHPDAVLRSFSGDVASFLGPQHLVVAHYAETLEADVATPATHSNETPRGEQQPLFAA